MGKRIFLLICLLCLLIPADVFALPIVDQTGNLLVNGNFESGTTSWVTSTSNISGGNPSAFTSWNQWVIESPLSTELEDGPLIDGDYSGRIVGNTNSGIFQYDTRPAGTYTFSAWILTLSGSAYIGLSYAPMTESVVSAVASDLNHWQYITVTSDAPNAFGGSWIYAASDNSDFLVDGAWLNTGSTNLSPFDPENGFHRYHHAPPVPEPTTMLLLGTGLLGLAGFRKRFKK